MNRFVVISFLILGWAFYELSGGADFKPGRVIATRAVIVPTPAKIVTVTHTPEVTRVSPAPTRAPRSPATTPASTDSQTDPAIAGATPPPVSLASLERGAALFATPLDGSDPSPITIAAPIPAPEPPAPDIRAVSGRRVNMREGPGTRFAVLASLSRGAKVEILDDPGSGWVKLRPLEGGPTGWMASSLIGAAAE